MCILVALCAKMVSGWTARSHGGSGRSGVLPGVNEDVRVCPDEESVMTERQLRLRGAGRWMFRSAALIGGVLGMVVVTTAMTGHQRLILGILVGAVAMPFVMVGLALSASGISTADSRPHLHALDVLGLLGAAFTTAVLFVSPDGFAALALVVASGALLTVGVRLTAPSGSAGQVP